MLNKTFIIVAAVIFGAAFGVAMLFALLRQSPHQQLVGGQPMSYWLLCLDADQESLRRDAQNNLPQFGVAAVGPLIQRLDSPQHETAEAASATLGVIGTPAVPLLAASLHSGSAERRIAAIDLLKSIGPPSAPAVPDVASLLDDPMVGTSAANFFVQFGAGPEAVAAASHVLAGTDQHRRLDAIRVLAEAPNDPRTAPALVEALKSTDPTVREAAYGAICDMPVMPVEAIDAMIERLNKLETRSVAVAALTRAGANAVVPLSRLNDNLDEGVRMDAVNLIRLILLNNAKLGASGDTYPLERFLNDTSVRVRTRARQSIDDVRQSLGQRARGVPHDLVTVDGPYSVGATATATTTIAGPAMPDTAAVHIDPTIQMPVTQPAATFDTPELMLALSQLEDWNDVVRGRAAAEIKAAWTPATPLPDFTKTTDPAEKLRRVRLLSFASQWQKYDLMISAANQGDRDLRIAAIFAMERALQSPRIVEKLIDLARHDRSGSIRYAAVKALAPAWKNPRAAAALRELISDADLSISAAATEAFEKGSVSR